MVRPLFGLYGYQPRPQCFSLKGKALGTRLYGYVPLNRIYNFTIQCLEKSVFWSGNL